MSAVFNEQAPPVFDAGMLARIADLRARGRSWDAVAAEICWDVIDLLAACRAEPRFPQALELAQQELDDEAQAEAMHRARALLRDPNSETALDAVKVITKYNDQRKRDKTRLELEHLRSQTRLEAERLRCETRLEVERLRAQARAGRGAQESEAKKKEEELPPLTEEQKKRQEEVFWRGQEWHAECAKRGFSEVYVWGGKHTTEAMPDESDRRVVVIPYCDSLRCRTVYWVMSYPAAMAADAMIRGTGGLPEEGATPMPAECPPEVFATRDTMTNEEYFAGGWKK